VIIDLPALRARTEDVVPMSELFFERAFVTRGKKYEGLTDSAQSLLQNYTWPGNIRELLNVVERTALLWSKSGKIDASDIVLPETFSPTTPPNPPKRKNSEFVDGYRPGISMNINAGSGDGSQTFTNLKKKWSDEFEKEYLQTLLTRTHGNVSAAAKESGIDRSNFLRLLRRHQINAQNFRVHSSLKQVA